VKPKEENPSVKAIACDDPNCNLKGWWLESGEDGEPVFCFARRHHGKKHVIRVNKQQFLDALKTKGPD